MIRSTAVLTVLFLVASSFLSARQYCLVSCCGCKPSPKTSRCVSLDESMQSSGCSSPCGKRAPVSTRDCGGCSNASQSQCLEKIVAETVSPCCAFTPSGRPDLSGSCGAADLTRCEQQGKSPQDRPPIRCLLVRSVQSAAPPKAPLSIDAPILETIDSEIWAERPRPGPVESPPIAVSPIIASTVLRI